jgi:hypothetical protein
MAALEGKKLFSMFLNFDVLKNQCIDTLNTDVQTILPISSFNVYEVPLI